MAFTYFMGHDLSDKIRCLHMFLPYLPNLSEQHAQFNVKLNLIFWLKLAMRCRRIRHPLNVSSFNWISPVLDHLRITGTDDDRPSELDIFPHLMLYLECVTGGEIPDN